MHPDVPEDVCFTMIVIQKEYYDEDCCKMKSLRWLEMIAGASFMARDPMDPRTHKIFIDS